MSFITGAQSTTNGVGFILLPECSGCLFSQTESAGNSEMCLKCRKSQKINRQWAKNLLMRQHQNA